MIKKYAVMSQAFRGGRKKTWYFDTMEEAEAYATKKYKSAVISWYENGSNHWRFLHSEYDNTVAQKA